MAEKNDAKKEDSTKKSGLAKKFALAVGAVLAGGALAVGGAIAVNGVDRGHATGADAQGHAVTLRTTTIKPVFERQTFDTDHTHYWCWSVASIKCPIPVAEKDKPAYTALKQQIGK